MKGRGGVKFIKENLGPCNFCGDPLSCSQLPLDLEIHIPQELVTVIYTNANPFIAEKQDLGGNACQYQADLWVQQCPEMPGPGAAVMTIYYDSNSHYFDMVITMQWAESGSEKTYGMKYEYTGYSPFILRPIDVNINLVLLPWASGIPGLPPWICYSVPSTVTITITE